MSAFVAIVPIIASWPAFAAAAAAAATALGLEAERAASAQAEAIDTTTSTEMPVPNSHTLAGTMSPGDTLVLKGDGFVVTFRRNPRGDCTMEVCGEGKSKEELRQKGKALLDGIAQQYAYQRLSTELKKKGYQVVGERVDEDRNIRLVVRRWS